MNLIVEYHWLNGDYASLPTLMGVLVRRRVAVIATPASTAPALAARAATATIPIVFGIASDPVKLGLVASFPRPNGNATGIDILGGELSAKRLVTLAVAAPPGTRQTPDIRRCRELKGKPITPVANRFRHGFERTISTWSPDRLPRDRRSHRGHFVDNRPQLKWAFLAVPWLHCRGCIKC